MSAATELANENLLTFADESMMDVPPINEDFDEKLQEAQEQLLKLRHEQDQLEKQKAELEVLSCQQEKFVSGRTVLAEQLTRSISTLEREAFEAEKNVEMFLHSKDTLARHLETIEALNPEDWSRDDLRAELGRALTAIEDAESDYRSAMSRLSDIMRTKGKNAVASAVAPGGTSVVPRDFTSSFLSGLAFTLPLMIFSIIALLLYMIFRV